MPACGMLNSLWADIALNTPSLDDPVRNGFDIRRELVEVLSATLLSTGGVDPYDPRHSPVYRDLRGLPPLLVQAAGRDVCHDDSVRLAASARAAGVDVTITEYPDVEHIWILNGPFRLRYGARYPQDGVEWFDCGVEPPEAVAAIDEMCAFVRRHVGLSRPGRLSGGAAAAGTAVRPSTISSARVSPSAGAIVRPAAPYPVATDTPSSPGTHADRRGAAGGERPQPDPRLEHGRRRRGRAPSARASSRTWRWPAAVTRTSNPLPVSRVAPATMRPPSNATR